MKRPRELLTTSILLALLLTPSDARAEEDVRRNQISLELGGEGMLASVHYERLLYAHTRRLRLHAVVGAGYFPLFVNGQAAAGTVLVPLGLRGLYGFGAHHVQAGLAVSSAVVLDAAGRDEGLLWGAFVTPSLGYRYGDLAAGRWSLGVAYAPRISNGVVGLRTDHFVRAEIGVLF